MNNEPIHFLPVNRFWENQPAKISLGDALVLGFAAGCALTTIVFCLCAYLTCH
ncbi:MAG: hypothetical protein WCH99_04940 [Verrucomicrobiota bacterium]